MDKKSIIGFALIGLILFAFSWYNTRQFNKQQAAQLEESRVRDSIERAEAFKAAAEAYPEADSVELARILQEGEFAAASDSAAAQTAYYKSDFLNAAAADSVEGSIVYLENDKIKVGISTKGAQVAEVLVKDYYKYDSTALYLIDERRNSTFDIELDAGQYINTMDFNFRVARTTDHSVAMRLYFDENSYIENLYTLSSDDYFVDMDLHFVGMNEYIPRSAYSFTISWAWDVPRLEKGYDNEKNYSSVNFRYADNENVKEISMRKDGGSESLAGQVQWVAFKQQFFSSILVSADNFTSGDVGGHTYAENNPDRYLMHDAAVLNVEYGDKSADFSKSFQFFFVPNHYPVLKSYDMKFDKLLPLGGWLVGSINKYIIIPVFNWLHKSISSYGLIILILTIMLKLVISPFTYKSYASSAKMRVLKPEVDKINERYSKESEAMKRQQATMDLYKRAGVSTFGGCLPLLFQFPLLYAMFRFFPASFELRQQSFLWAEDLSCYDSILDFGFRMPLYGNHISLFALLMGISMWAYSKMTFDANSAASSQQMPGMKFMSVWFMPIFMVCLCNNFSSGLSYYYLLSNLFTIGQNFAIRKWFINEDKLYAQLKQKADSKEAPKKSKFQQRLEEAYRIQQQQQKAQRK
ncbi:MAG: membrane protein insertase YidC [Bacteroidales bacterium]|nr:membrane protein insertase YidC [Bacteroidales bacterium]